MKARILLVEDDLNLGFVVQDNLKATGHKVALASDGRQGLVQFNSGDYDLCILDVMLPHKDGFALAEEIRKVNSSIPIIFLTAKSMTEDRIKGFKSGGDDYITKPFSMEELSLRIDAILKRVGSEKSVPEAREIFQLGDFEFQYRNLLLVHKDGSEQKLTKKESEVLKLLTSRKGEVMERELILNMVWGDDNYFNGRSLDVFITKLRKLLKKDEKITITNVHGVGFKLTDQ